MRKARDRWSKCATAAVAALSILWASPLARSQVTTWDPWQYQLTASNGMIQLQRLMVIMEMAQSLTSYMGNPMGLVGMLGISALGPMMGMGFNGSYSRGMWGPQSTSVNGASATSWNYYGLYRSNKNLPANVVAAGGYQTLKPYAAVEQQKVKQDQLVQEADTKLKELTQQAQQTMQQLESASTVSETLKLIGKLEGIRIAQAKYEDEKRSATEALMSLHALNQSEAQKTGLIQKMQNKGGVANFFQSLGGGSGGAGGVAAAP